MAGERVVVDTETEFEAEALPPGHTNGVSAGFLAALDALGASPRLLGSLSASANPRSGAGEPGAPPGPPPPVSHGDLH